MSAMNDSTPRDMFEKESIQRFIDGLKLAASCARELNQLAPKKGWGKVAEQLSHLCALGYKLSRARGLSRGDLLQRTDRIAQTDNEMIQQR